MTMTKLLLAAAFLLLTDAQETTIKGFVDRPSGRPQDVVHLQEARGDPLPAPPTVMRIYAHRYCPHAQSVLLAAYQHAVPFEVVNINPESRPAWFRAKINPLNQSPAIEYPCGRIYLHWEALVELIDKTSANWSCALSARDPFEEAQGRAFRDLYLGFVHDNFYVVQRSDNSTKREEVFGKILEKLEFLQQYMVGPFISGEKPRIVDFLVYPWLERLAPLATYHQLEGGDISKTMPKWRAWFQAMRATEGVQGAYLPAAMHVRHLEHVVGGNRDPYHYE